MQKGSVAVYFKLLSQRLPRESEEEHGNPQPGQRVSRPKFEPGIPEYLSEALPSVTTRSIHCLKYNHITDTTLHSNVSLLLVYR
jgi:hypothetical protein